MSIKISLSDNSQQTLPSDFTNLSSLLKSDIVNHIHTSIDVFNKIKEFGTHYIYMDSKEKKIFENIDKIWEKPNVIQDWCESFLDMHNDILVELTNESYKLNIKPLVDLCCYKLANVISKNNIDNLKDIFRAEYIDAETDWI